MNLREYEVLAELYSDPELATTEEIDKELEANGINYEEFRSKVLKKINDIKRESIYTEAESKIRTIRELLSKLKGKPDTDIPDAELEMQLELAFNKLGKLSKEDIVQILNDEKKLDQLKEEIERLKRKK